jgi:hypothetical protein
VTFPSECVHELASIGDHLDAFGLTFQTNYGRAEERERPRKAFLSIYDHSSQAALLEAVRDELLAARRSALADLVRARGNVPEDLLGRMRATIDAGKSYAYLADALNKQGIIDGMGGRRWTAAKVRKALRNDGSTHHGSGASA